MASKRTNRTIHADAGVTLIELVVAMAIAGIVISLTLASWTFISTHTVLGKRKSEFYSQTEQTESLIVNDIRKSLMVVSYEKSAITFITGNNGDTITYAFDGATLRKNGAAMRFVSDGAAVVRFSIEKDDAASRPAERPLTSPSAAQSAQDIVLTVTLGMKGRAGAASEIPSSVKVRCAPQGDLYNKN